MQMTEEIRQRIARILVTAREKYESDPEGGLHETPFLFFVGEDGSIKISPVQVNMDEMVVETMGHYGDRLLEQIALRQVRDTAARVAPTQLAGVGYLFPARGDFPQTDQDVLLARLLRGQGASFTPWAREGVVFIFDGPDGRESWACLRDQGEVADPLSEPAMLRVEASHIDPLYPHRLSAEGWE